MGQEQLRGAGLPYIVANSVAQLTAPDLLVVVRRFEARGHLRKAHTVFQICGRVLRYAVATGRAERDVSRAAELSFFTIIDYLDPV